MSFDDDVVAATMIDRLVHHAEVVALKGDWLVMSPRLRLWGPAEVAVFESVAVNLVGILPDGPLVQEDDPGAPACDQTDPAFQYL